MVSTTLALANRMRRQDKRREILHDHSTYPTVDRVPISDQIAGSHVPGERLNNLLGGPCGGGIGRHVKIDVVQTMMGQNDKDKQHMKASGWQ